MQVAGSGKSMTSKNRQPPAAKPGTERPIGKKEKRPSDRDGGKDDEFKPWNTARRPSGSSLPQDNAFCVEDEGTASTVESLMYSLTISDPHEKGNPLVFASPGFETLTGYSGEELLGRNCKVLQGKAPDKDKVQQLQQGMQGRAFTAVELTNYRKDGRAFQNLLCVLPVLDGYGNVLKFLGVQCDVDERKRRDPAYADEHGFAKWQEQVHHYLTAFMLTDNCHDHAPIQAVSPGFTALTGYSQLDVLGCSCLCLCGPDSSASSMRKWVASQWVDKPVAVKLLCYRKDGSPFWAYVFSCPLTTARGSSAKQNLCIVVDITSSRLKRVGKYVLGKVIGSGAYGIVRLGKAHGADEGLVAIKAVDASRFRSISEIEQIQEEMSVLSSLKHPHIIRLIEIHFVNSVFFLVMEFASGGSLVKYIRSHANNQLPEQDAHHIFLQIISALDYCHRRRVIHRDLKPENILLDARNNIKIADFGLAAVTAPFGKGLTTQCGTPEFTAPEITLGKEYDGPSVDIWSMGVILYEAVAGHLPFTGSSQSSLFKAIQKGVYPSLPSHLSSKCRHLIQGMLRVDPGARLTMEDILAHPWVRASEGEHGDEDDLLTPGGWSEGLDAAGDESGSHHGFRSSSGRSYKLTDGGGGDEDGEDTDAESVVRGSGRQSTALGNRQSMALSTQESRRSHGLLSTRASRVSKSGQHDSVRLVFDAEADKDDPITAAIMRAQMATMSILSGASAAERDGSAYRRPSLGDEGDDGQGASNRSTPFSKQKTAPHQQGRDMTPGRRDAAANHQGATSASTAVARMAVANAARRNVKDGLPALSGAAAAASPGTAPADRRRTEDTSATAKPGGATSSGNGAGALASKASGNGAVGHAGAGAAKSAAAPGGKADKEASRPRTGLPAITRTVSSGLKGVP